MMMYKLVIFDLDGTLYDKRGLSLRMVLHAPWDICKMLRERKVRASMKGAWLGDEHSFYDEFFKRLTKDFKLNIEGNMNWYYDRYLPLMAKLIGKYQPIGDWVMPFIEECQAKGVKMVVLSDYERAKEKLRALGIDDTCFDWVVTSSDLGGLKPAPELMYHVAERMGVAVEDCLVIGDREDTDGEMARAVGADFRKVKY